MEENDRLENMEKNIQKLVAQVSVIESMLSNGILKTQERQDRRLDKHSERLDEINRLSLAELQTLKAQLAASQQALTEARKQSEQLQAQLAALKVTSQNQEALLQNAEKSSKALEKTQAKKALSEYAVLIDDFNGIAGVAYGRYFRIGESSRYIGARASYNWDDNKFGLWVSVLA